LVRRYAGEHLEVVQNLFVDSSLIMALINALVGGPAFAFTRGLHARIPHVAHREVRDRRPLFFALLFIFMSAMFGLIFANNLVWLFLFWETTLCSFLLSRYTQTDEAKRNALRALVMNCPVDWPSRWPSCGCIGRPAASNCRR